MSNRILLTTSSLLPMVIAMFGLALISNSYAENTERLPYIVWSAQVKDGHTSDIQVLNNGMVVASRGSYAYELFSANGESLLVVPSTNNSKTKLQGIAFLDDGGYVKMTADTTDYKPGEPYVTMTRVSPYGRELWSNLLPSKGSRGARIQVNDATIITVTEIWEILDQRQQVFHRVTGYNLDGDQMWIADILDSRNMGQLTITNDNKLIFCGNGSLKCFDTAGQLLWEHQSWGVRLGFSIMPCGSCYALLKAPERLIKVNPDGSVAWECNITKHATGRLSPSYETGLVFGDFVTESTDGTVYVCDAYGMLDAISSKGEFLWSVSEPRPEQMSLDEWDEEWQWGCRFNCDPTISPDGTIYLKSRQDNLMAVNHTGEVLYVDKRFVDVDSPVRFGADGKIYLGSAGWLYALDPNRKSGSSVLDEQEAIYEEERQRMREWEAEWARDLEENSDQNVQVEAENAVPDEDLEPEFDMSQPSDPGKQPVADRTVVAGVIVPALLQYYSANDEFPPFLLGANDEQDPLISSGLLDAFPRSWPQMDNHHCFSRPESPYYSNDQRWSCAVSTPGDPSNSQYIQSDSRSVHRRRAKCLSVQPGFGPRNGLPYFGYQRGDWLGTNKQEAWLWFYGSNIWPERNNPIPRLYKDWHAQEYYDLFIEFSSFGPQGFDLLNDETGELIPDGKRDGICLLYKLANGELVEVIRADGI